MDKVEPLAESGSWEFPIVEVLGFFFLLNFNYDNGFQCFLRILVP